MNHRDQKARILHYLKSNGSMTTLEARNILYIMHPASRIQQLREEGVNIQTVTLENRVARYVLGFKGVSHD